MDTTTATTGTIGTALGAGAYLVGGLTLAATAVDAATVASWIERVGLPVFLLLVAMLGVYRAARWVAEHVFRPLVGRGVAMLDAVQVTTASQAKALDQVATSIEKIAESEGASRACVERLERAAADERTTTRLALGGLADAIASLERVARGETPAPKTGARRGIRKPEEDDRDE